MVNDDIYLVLSATQDGKVRSRNPITGKEFECAEPIFVSGRITQHGTNILGKSDKGLFYTPVLFSEWTEDAIGNKKERYFGLPNNSLYQTDGKTTVNLPHYKEFDLSKLRLPTLISNLDSRGPSFFRLVAYGEHALRLATMPKGSDLTVEGEMRKYWIGNQTIDVVWVRELRINKKGAVISVQ